MSANDATQEVALSRDMSLLDITMIGIGAMIGAGLFVLTGIAAGKAGPALIVAFALNGVVAMFTALAYAELGSCFPQAGGGYQWVAEAFPGRVGFLTGWVSWLANSGACSLYVLGFGAYLGEILRCTLVHLLGQDSTMAALAGHDLFTKAAGVLACAAFVYINYRGASETGKAETIATMSKLVILGLFVASGLWALSHGPDWHAAFAPFFPRGWGGVFTAMGLTYIAFEGYEIIAQSGEEVRNPRRNIPMAIIISILVVIPIYCLVAFLCIGAVTPPAGETVWEHLGTLGELGVVEAARQFMFGGRFVGGVILLVGGLFATISALNATVYSSSRVSFAMGRDGNLPRAFAAVHEQRCTPYVAVLVSGAIIAFIAVALPIADVAAAAAIMFLTMFALVNVSAIILRRRRPDLKRSFRVPLMPYIPVAAAIASLGLTTAMLIESPKAAIVTVGWLAVGLLVYPRFARQQAIERRRQVPVVLERAPAHASKYRALVPLARPEHVGDLMLIGSALARHNQGEVTALNVIAVPEILPIEEGLRFQGSAETLLDHARQVAQTHGVPVRSLARVGHHVERAICDTILEYKVDMTVVGWRGWSGTQDKVMGTVLDPLVHQGHTDLAVVKPVSPMSEVRRILVGITGSPQARLTVHVAKALESLTGATVDYINFQQPGEEGPAPAVAFWSNNTNHELRIPVQTREAKSPTAGLIEAATECDLLILGAAPEGVVKHLFFGANTREIASRVDCSVIMVRQYEGRARKMFREILSPIPEEARRAVDYGDEG